ncbi:MAG: hypothetical protein EA350_07225 [Gemmatimonadales bacterium]|nr:MAG: hypothetical protein EA350_07225 [Gemmatimonadales bacterium]
MTSFPAISAMALGQVAVAADTVVTVRARDAYDLVFGLAAGTFVFLLLIVILALLFILFQIRNAIRSLDRTRERFLADEAMESVRKTVGHVESMANSLRAETDRVSASVGKVSEQVTLASRRMEERIEEFNALMEVVQEEAENAFIDTASSARGVRRSLGELGELARRKRASRASGEARAEEREARRYPALDPDPAALSAPEERSRPLLEGGVEAAGSPPGAEERPLFPPDPTPDLER